MEAQWNRFTPLVLEPGVTPHVVYEVKVVDGSPSAVRLELLAAARVVELRDDGIAPDAVAGDGIYTAQLVPSDLTAGFDATDVNRKFLGFLRLYDGAAVDSEYNVVIDILTPEIPAVDLRPVAPDLQYTDHLVNLFDPGFFAAETLAAVPAVTRRFYSHFGDDYDFLNVIYATARFENSGHFAVRIEASGLGGPRFDRTRLYGSAGRLLGITIFQFPTVFDGADRVHSHELGHQWVNFLRVAPLDTSVPHWPLSDLATDIIGWGMGRNTQGLQFPFRLEPTAGGYNLVPDDEPAEFNDLSLYLMGLLPAGEVGHHFVFDNQDQNPSAFRLTGPVTEVSIGDVVRASGPRSPAYPQARRLFRVATIIVSEQGLLPEPVMRLYDHFAVRGEGEAVVRASSGRWKGEAKPFYLATCRRGRLDFGIRRRILVDASRDGGVWWFPQAGPFDPAAAHQGRALAEHLRSLGHRVTELARTSGGRPVISEDLLSGYDLVIRAVGLGRYHLSEIDAYRTFVDRGGALLLLADHGAPDDLARSFRLRFEGVNRGIGGLSRLTAHRITQGVGPLPYQAGGGLTDFPGDAVILGRLSLLSYLDRNGNGRWNWGEPWSPAVLGALSRGFGRIVFCGDANLWLDVPQPLVRNTLAWLGGA